MFTLLFSDMSLMSLTLITDKMFTVHQETPKNNKYMDSEERSHKTYLEELIIIRAVKQFSLHLTTEFQ